ncbi:MAG: type II toxin-antitoxin system HicB family antitoxin [Patescibacteria group bacterium]
MKREFTAVFKKEKKQIIAWIEEIPGVNTQGRTMREAKENIREALVLILEANREFTQKQKNDDSLTRMPIKVAVGAL